MDSGKKERRIGLGIVSLVWGAVLLLIAAWFLIEIYRIIERGDILGITLFIPVLVMVFLIAIDRRACERKGDKIRCKGCGSFVKHRESRCPLCGNPFRTKLALIYLSPLCLIAFIILLFIYLW